MAVQVYKRGDFYWVRGSVRGRAVRCTLDTRNREVAHHRAAALELGTESGLHPTPWPQLAEAFLASYRDGTRHNLEGLCRRLSASVFTADGPRFLNEVTLDHLDRYLAAREIGNNTKRKEIEHLRRLWSWAVDHEYVHHNIARKLKLPPAIAADTQPFTHDELARLAAAIERLDEFPELRDRADTTKVRLRAQLAVLVHTGLRGSDLVHLKPSHIAGGHLTIRTRKFQVLVRIPVARAVTDALAAVTPAPAGYYFWTGEGRWQTARANLHRTFQRLAKRAGVAHCHPHRFRDTFSVNLLLAGADIRIVSKLLGHTSIRTTEKYYAPWVQGFQSQAAAAIARAAAASPIQPAAPAKPSRKHRRP